MKAKKLIYILLGAVICIFTFSVMTLNTNHNNSVQTSSTVLLNKKIGWGIKRAENHEQPDLGSGNLKLLKEYDGIAMGNSEDKYV